MNNLVQWRNNQVIIEKDCQITNYRRKIWQLEAQWTQQCGNGFTLNLGGGDNPLGHVSCDPQSPRHIKCVGEALPFQNQCFDTILVYSVLDHCLSDEIMLQEAKRVLRHDGRLLIMQSVYGFHVWLRKVLGRWKDPNHLRHYFFNQLHHLIEKSGFTVKNHVFNREFNVEFLEVA